MSKRKRSTNGEMAELAELERIFRGICKHHISKRDDLPKSEAKVSEQCPPRLLIPVRLTLF